MWMSSGVGVCLTVLGLCVSVCVCVCVAVGAHLVELVGNQHARGQPARRSGAASYEHGHMGQHGWEPSTREARGARGPARESWVADQHVRVSTSRVSYRETLLIEIIQSSRASAWMCACEHHALMGFIYSRTKRLQNYGRLEVTWKFLVKAYDPHEPASLDLRSRL